MSYELHGKIKTIMEPKTFGSGFTIREFVVTVEDGKYPQDIVLQFVQDKVSLLDTIDEGQDVTVHFDIRGKEYNGRYFNNLQAWKIESESSASNYDDDDYEETKTPDDFDEEGEQIPF